MKKKLNGRDLKILLLRQALFGASYQERLGALTSLSRYDDQGGWLVATVLISEKSLLKLEA